jgi:hypothetical protein
MHQRFELNIFLSALSIEEQHVHIHRCESLTKQITNSTEQCQSCENNNQSANREGSLISQQLTFHCLIRNSPTPLATINQINLVLDPIPISYFFHNDVEFILILSLEPKSSKLSVSLDFLHQINQTMKILNPKGIYFIWATL